ncbi:MAG: hypothetical protein ACFFCD_00560 [Promethearchaeota archaeon]
MGTSPFMGAGQFGSRSRAYYETFWNKPENMVRLFMAAIELGFDGIQAVAYPRILDALHVAREKTGQHIPIVASVPPQEIQESLWNLADIKAEVVLAHGAITDKALISNDYETLAKFANQVREFAIPGAATHRPNETLPKLLQIDLDLEYLMTPLNAIGKFVSDLEGLLKVINENSSNTKVIAMKPLAAGEIMPQEALEFLFQQNIDAVAVGITSKDEAKEIMEIVETLRETL